MLIVGAVYLVGQKVTGATEKQPLLVKVLSATAVAVLSGIILRLLGLAEGEHLVHMTIAGLLIITVTLFS